MAKHSGLKSWTIKHTEALLPSDNTKKYRIKSLDVAADELATAKSQLDDKCAKQSFLANWAMFDPFKQERAIIAEIGNAQNVSNAWLKCFELIMAYGLVDSIKNIKPTESFMHFDNASFPGSFIIATHHLLNTLYPQEAGRYVWRGSSLLSATKQTVKPLEDKYGLYERYPTHWLMHEKNNGDVLSEANQRDFVAQIGGQVSLYTSDLGFDVSCDYNNQETLHQTANIGQILSGLLTLKPGGSFITKQYTFFEPTTVAVMYATSFFFDEFYLCKPFTSRMANSETYLVGKGYRGGADFTHPYIKAMLDRITGKTPIGIPMFDAKLYPKQYLTMIVNAAKTLSKDQIGKINLDLERVKDINATLPLFQKECEPQLVEWFMLNPILPIKTGL